MTVNVHQGVLKKAIGIGLTAIMGVSLLAGCSNDSKNNTASEVPQPAKVPSALH